MYGARASEADRSMKIVYSETAREVYKHPLIRRHPETGRESLFGCLGYIVGIEGMAQEEAMALVGEVYQWQIQEQFQYNHKWQENMLVIWDNRCVLHRRDDFDASERRLLRRCQVLSPAQVAR